MANLYWVAVVGTISRKIMNKVKLRGINACRGSYQQISESIISKLNSGVISRFSVKTGYKIFVSSLYDSMAGTIFESLLLLF